MRRDARHYTWPPTRNEFLLPGPGETIRAWFETVDSAAQTRAPDRSANVRASSEKGAAELDEGALS
jgi:hypothetical protein